MKQRIALVAVSALTAGLFSVVSTPAANAAANVAVGTTQTAAVVEGVLNIATVNTDTGSAVTTTTLVSSVPTLLRSVGLINVSDVAGGLVAGTTQTATIISGGKLVVYTGFEANDLGALITVEGGTLACNVTGTTGNTQAINTTATACSAFDASASADDTLVATISPSSGSTAMTVRLYNKASASSAASHVISSTQGTLVGLINVTVAASSVAGTLAASKSGVYYTSAYDTTTVFAADEAAGLGSSAATSLQYASITIRDAYGTAVSSGKLLQASATNGARVAIDGGSGVAGSSSTAFSTSTSNATALTVSNPTNAPLSTTVTVTYDGKAIGTKTFVFWGEVSKITWGTPEIGKQGTSSGNDVKYYLVDAANNPIYFTYATVASTFTPSSGWLSAAASDDTVTNATSPAIAADGTITTGVANFACGATTTSQNISIQYVNNSGTIITSPTLAVKCAGDAVSYKLSYDKASYTPGEIAIATVSFFDKAGNPSHDNTNAEPTAAAVVISMSGMKGTQAIVAPANGDNTANGAVSYNFVVDVTEGTYTNSVVASTANTAATNAGLTATKAATSTFAVKSATTSVSNADVLKSIVALIASINKQIQALQKLILARR